MSRVSQAANQETLILARAAGGVCMLGAGLTQQGSRAHAGVRGP